MGGVEEAVRFARFPLLMPGCGHIGALGLTTLPHARGVHKPNETPALRGYCMAMSQENVVSVRENLDAFDRRDRAAFLSAYDPACEVIPDRNWPEAGAIRGGEAAWEFYVGVAETFGMDSDDAEVIDAGGDTVVVHRGAQARGRMSGVDVVFDYSSVVTFRDGKVVREQWFADRAAALEAAGLESG